MPTKKRKGRPGQGRGQNGTKCGINVAKRIARVNGFLHGLPDKIRPRIVELDEDGEPVVGTPPPDSGPPFPSLNPGQDVGFCLGPDGQDWVCIELRGRGVIDGTFLDETPVFAKCLRVDDVLPSTACGPEIPRVRFFFRCTESAGGLGLKLKDVPAIPAGEDAARWRAQGLELIDPSTIAGVGLLNLRLDQVALPRWCGIDPRVEAAKARFGLGLGCPLEYWIAVLFAAANPVLFDVGEGCFFFYGENVGVWERVSNQEVERRIQEWIRDHYSSEKDIRIFSGHPLKSLEYRKISGIRNQLELITKKPDKWEWPKADVHCLNGVIPLKSEPGEPRVKPFSPFRYARNRIDFPYHPKAECPRFLEFLSSALEADDIEVLHRWCGAVLLADNPAHQILLMVGAAGSGKSTFIDILRRILGTRTATLRTQFLGERFEYQHYIGKTLLIGADVGSKFLNNRTAQNLKQLVGGDPLVAEIKNGGCVPLQGDFNVVAYSNSWPQVKLDGDRSAWARRLATVEFVKAPEKPIANLSEQLVQEEGPGILRWFVGGALKYERGSKTAGFFKINSNQFDRVQQMLSMRGSCDRYIDDRIVLDPTEGGMTQLELYNSYQLDCALRDEKPETPFAFKKRVRERLAEHGVHLATDIARNGRNQRGFRGVCVTPDETRSDG